MSKSIEQSAQGLSLPADLFVPLVKTDGEDVVLSRPSISYWQDAWMRLKSNKVAIVSAAYIVTLSLAAIIVPFVIDYSHDYQEIWNKHAVPSLGEHVYVDDGSLAFEAKHVDLDALNLNSETSLDAPQSPKNVRLIGEARTTGVQLEWDPVARVDGYRIYRSISKDTLGVPLEDIFPEQVNFLDTTSLAKGVTYYYFVTSYNAFGDSPDPEMLEVNPRFSISLETARTIEPNAQPGDVIKTKAHYLGTDYLGRDMLARVMMGARVSLFIGFIAPIIYILFGILYGSISGYFGGLIDDIMMRITDIVSTVPELLVIIILQVVLGNGVTTLIIALVAVSWARSARQIRGEVLRLREMEFVHSAKVLGTSFPKIVVRHLVPNVMGTVLVLLTLAVPSAIFTEAFLSFIGLGIEPPMTSWGIVTKEGAAVFLTYPHELVIPSVMICLTMLAFNLLGDGLRDALDPKLRGTR